MERTKQPGIMMKLCLDGRGLTFRPNLKILRYFRLFPHQELDGGTTMLPELDKDDKLPRLQELDVHLEPEERDEDDVVEEVREIDSDEEMNDILDGCEGEQPANYGDPVLDTTDGSDLTKLKLRCDINSTRLGAMRRKLPRPNDLTRYPLAGWPESSASQTSRYT